MRIEFDDSSFLEIMPSAQDKDRITFVICGLKDYKQLTMSYSDLKKEQVRDIITFLTSWLDEDNT